MLNALLILTTVLASLLASGLYFLSALLKDPLRLVALADRIGLLPPEPKKKKLRRLP